MPRGSRVPGRDVLQRLLETVACGVLLASTILPFLAPQPVVAVGVWVLAVTACHANREQLELAHRAAPDHRGTCVIPCLPGILALQYYGDRLAPLLGSSCLLFGVLALIASIIRASAYPTARLLR